MLIFDLTVRLSVIFCRTPGSSFCTISDKILIEHQVQNDPVTRMVHRKQSELKQSIEANISILDLQEEDDISNKRNKSLLDKEIAQKKTAERDTS